MSMYEMFYINRMFMLLDVLLPCIRAKKNPLISGLEDIHKSSYCSIARLDWHLPVKRGCRDFTEP